MAAAELVIDCTGGSDDSSSTSKARSSRQQQMRDRRNARKRLTGRSDALPAPEAIVLRKGEPSGAAASNSKKRSRALERRNERRRARQRGMSPRSPDGGPRSSDPRIGKPLPDLPTDDEDDEEQKQLKRFRNRKAVKDAVLHSTAWRYVKLDKAPLNLLPDRPDVMQPFATEFDRPLEEFDPDNELSSKCAISMAFGQAPALSLQSATHHEPTDVNATVTQQVNDLLAEAVPSIKKCHAHRVKAVLANTRQQIASYIANLPAHHAEMATLAGLSRQQEISQLEKVAARTILKSVSTTDRSSRYFIGRGESAQSERECVAEKTIYLSHVVPIHRSTTCMLTRGTYRVEDDPIIRFVPYFTSANQVTSFAQFEGFENSLKATMVAADEETKEYLLRYIVNSCNGIPAVFEVLQEMGLFAQPFADYTDIQRRYHQQTRYINRLQTMNALRSNARGTEALEPLLRSYHLRSRGASLQDRLDPPSSTFDVNLLQSKSATSPVLGVRDANSFDEMASRYRDLFCRRCYRFNCANHDVVPPITRADPKYPVVKASKQLFRLTAPVATVDMEENAVKGLTTDLNHDGKVAKNEEQGEDSGSSPKEDGNIEPDDEDEGGGGGLRRSGRSHTAASTKASSSFQSQRPKEKKRVQPVRSRVGLHTDNTEYLTHDEVYRSLTIAAKTKMLSTDVPCGTNCSKPGTGGGQKLANDLEWSCAERALLLKAEGCFGRNPCLIATLVLTRTCADVAYFYHLYGESLNDATREVKCERRRTTRPNGGIRGNNQEHLRRTRHQRMKDRGANHEFMPCNHHEGSSCNTGACSCMQRDHFCEKACGCARDCANRFPGCKCSLGQCRTEACPCFFARRECDPDLCVSCGASEVPVLLVDPSSKNKTCEQLKICCNANILRGRFRSVGMAPSETHGWGAYALEKIKAGDFVYEYTGGLLSQDEAERRGNTYDKTSISFLFDLNEDTVVDATRKGNKSKFANHSSENPSCVARIMRVNGDDRIGIYAARDIGIGDELFFDYGYNGVIPDWTQARITGSKVSSNDTTASTSEVTLATIAVAIATEDDKEEIIVQDVSPIGVEDMQVDSTEDVVKHDLLRGTCEQKRYAAEALGQLARWDKSNGAKIGETEAISLLIELLQGNDAQKESAAEALAYLADQDRNRLKMAEQGAIPFLVGLLSGTAKQEERSCCALRFIVGAKEAYANEISALGAMLNGTEAQKQNAASALAALACHNHTIPVTIAQQGALPLLIELLKESDLSKEKAALAIGNIVWGNVDYAMEVVSLGGIDVLIRLLRGTEKKKQYGAFALAALTVKNGANRVAIARKGGILVLMSLLEGTELQRQNAALALKYMVLENEANGYDVVARDGVDLLVKLLKGTEKQKEYALSVLVSLPLDDYVRAEIAKSEAIQASIALLSETKKVKILVAKFLAKITRA